MAEAAIDDSPRCEWCQSPFEAAPRKRFCGAACRLRSHRAKRQRGRQSALALATPIGEPIDRSAALAKWRAKHKPRPVEEAEPTTAAKPETPAAAVTVGPVYGDVTGAARADVIADWSARALRIPSGPRQGEPFTFDVWQRDWLRGALADGIREAGLSVARKNGKTGLIAAASLAFLDGPLNAPNWRALVASLTGELAKEMRHAIEATAATANGGAGLKIRVMKSPTPGHVLGANGTRLDILAADKSTGHSLGADLAIVDEMGLMGENRRDLIDAVISSISSRNGRLWAISVQGRGPMFAEMRDRAGQRAVYFREYVAPERCALDDEGAWHDANPGLASGIKSIEYMRDMAARALATAASQPNFRAFDLNQETDPTKDPIVSVSEWRACCVEPDELPPRDGDMVIGFDIGGSLSMCACVGYWPVTGRFEAYAGLPGIPDLRARGEADAVGMRYVRMHERGELWTWPGVRVTPAGDFLKACAARFEGETVAAAGADRYRRKECEQALAESNLSLAWPMVWRGAGAHAQADGSHDVRAFQRAVIGGRLKCVNSLLMDSAIASSVLRYDGAGNPALNRINNKSRNDPVQAAVIAAGLAEVAGTAPRMYLV